MKNGMAGCVTRLGHNGAHMTHTSSDNRHDGRLYDRIWWCEKLTCIARHCYYLVRMIAKRFVDWIGLSWILGEKLVALMSTIYHRQLPNTKSTAVVVMHTCIEEGYIHFPNAEW